MMLANLQLAFLWVALIGVFAGTINATVGFGNLVGFIALTTLLGVPPLGAQLASQICAPASFATARWWRHEHRVTSAMLWAGCLGAMAGAIVLALSSERAVAQVAPWGVFAGALLLVALPRLREVSFPWQLPGLAASGVWGGLVGPGVGSFVYACVDGPQAVHTKNALCLSMGVVVSAPLAGVAVVNPGLVNWSITAALAGGMLVGGLLGSVVLGPLPRVRAAADGLRHAMAATGGVAGVYMLSHSLMVTVVAMACAGALALGWRAVRSARHGRVAVPARTGLGVDSAMKGVAI